MKKIIEYIIESRLVDLKDQLKATIDGIEDEDLLVKINRKIKNLTVNSNNIEDICKSNELFIFLHEKFNRFTDVKLIRDCIIEHFDLEDEDLYNFVTKSEFPIPDNNSVIHIFDLIDAQCNNLNIKNDSFKKSLKNLFIDLANITPGKVGAFEYALRTLFSNITDTTPQDVAINDIKFEIKSDSFAIKSNGAQSAVICEQEFLKALDIDYKSNTSSKTNNGIFSSYSKLNEFNEYLKEHNVSKEKIVDALAKMVNKRCSANLDINGILNKLIDENNLLKVRTKESGRYTIPTNNIIEKLLVCCDFYNLIKSGHNHLLIFETKKVKKLTSTCDTLYFKFNENSSFESIWEAIHVKPETEKDSFYFNITSLWGYDPNETSSQMEQNLVCSVQVKIGK